MPGLPGISHKAAVRALRQAGFRVAREGKHIVMTDGRRIITIPRANPVKDAGLSIDDFRKLL